MQQLPPVDWSTAARTGGSVVHPGPELTAAEIERVVAELRGAAERAEDEREYDNLHRRQSALCGRPLVSAFHLRVDGGFEQAYNAQAAVAAGTGSGVCLRNA